MYRMALDYHISNADFVGTRYLKVKNPRAKMHED